MSVNLTDKKGNVLPEAYLLPEGSTAKDLVTWFMPSLEKASCMLSIRVIKKDWEPNTNLRIMILLK